MSVPSSFSSTCGAGVCSDSFRSLPPALRASSVICREEYLRDSKEEETSSPFVQKVRKIIQRHLGNPDLSTELIANSLSISRSTLYRRWKKGSDETISQTINLMRLKEALRLIEEDGLSISEAAYATGYNQLTYFSRVFKKIYGMTAQEYVNE